MNKLVPALLAVLAVSAFAQEYRGTISGAVTDPTSSPVPGAEVTVVETHTNTRVRSVTQGSGEYTAAALLPGDYDINVKIAGFREFTRKSIHVGAGDHPIIDIQLQVGDTAQAMEVTADAPLINSENASIGQAIPLKKWKICR